MLDTDPVETSVATHLGYGKVLETLAGSKVQTGLNIWSTVTKDVCLIQHLLALYFCWEYPVSASLSKEHFLKDFRDGKSRYCSPILECSARAGLPVLQQTHHGCPS